MKVFFFVIISYLFISCNQSGQSKPGKQDRSATGSLGLFTDSLSRLDENAPATIDGAVQLYNKLIPKDSTQADSAASALISFIESVASKQNENLANDTMDYSPLVDEDSFALTPELLQKKNQLAQNRLKFISDGEGGVYIVPAYDLLLPAITAKTSKAVNDYLHLRASDETEPAVLDAGIAVDMKEIVRRLVLSEELTKEKLPVKFKNDVQYLNQTYTNLLITGVDNTPSIEYDKPVLTANFKDAYQYLLTNFPNAQAAQKIKAWMAVVQTANKTKVDAFLRQYQE